MPDPTQKLIISTIQRVRSHAPDGIATPLPNTRRLTAQPALTSKTGGRSNHLFAESSVPYLSTKHLKAGKLILDFPITALVLLLPSLQELAITLGAKAEQPEQN